MHPDWEHEVTSHPCWYVHALWIIKKIFSVMHLRVNMSSVSMVPLKRSAMQRVAVGHVVIVILWSHSLGDLQMGQVGHWKGFSVGTFLRDTLAMQPDWLQVVTWYFRFLLQNHSLELTFVQFLVISWSIFLFTHFRAKTFCSHKAMQKSAFGHVVLAKVASHASCEVLWHVGHQKSSFVALPTSGCPFGNSLTLALHPGWLHKDKRYLFFLCLQSHSMFPTLLQSSVNSFCICLLMHLRVKTFLSHSAMQKSALGHVVLAKLASHDSWEVVSQVGHQKSSSTAWPRHKTVILRKT